MTYPSDPQSPGGQPQQPYMPPVIINNNVAASSSASVSAGHGVVVVRRRMSVGTHLLLTFLTGGLWLFTGWPYMALRGR